VDRFPQRSRNRREKAEHFFADAVEVWEGLDAGLQCAFASIEIGGVVT